MRYLIFICFMLGFIVYAYLGILLSRLMQGHYGTSIGPDVIKLMYSLTSILFIFSIVILSKILLNNYLKVLLLILCLLPLVLFTYLNLSGRVVYKGTPLSREKSDHIYNTKDNSAKMLSTPTTSKK